MHHLDASLDFAGHMARHIILMDVVAPLLVLAWRPSDLPAWTRVLTAPAIAAVLHGAVMWGWHAPVAFNAAMHSSTLHLVMQASFLLAGVVFWLGVLPKTPARRGPAVFWLFMTVMHVGFLGGLITFAPQPLYADVELPDQQLAGLIMWICGGGLYVVAGVIVAARWLTGVAQSAHEESLRWHPGSSTR
jgi:putative membrane protein